MSNLKRTISGEISNNKKIRLCQGELKEIDVGITHFINANSKGFSGQLKTLHSDFQVNEIEPNGNVVHLLDEGFEIETNKEKKAREKLEYDSKTPEEKQEIENKKQELLEEDKSELLKYINEDELTQIQQLFFNGSKFETKSTFSDKELRTNLHQLIRKAFNGRLDTTTTPEQTFKIQIAKKNSARKPKEDLNIVDENGVLNFGIGPYKPNLHFTLFKQNRDTMEVANTIAKLLKISHKFVNYAGTKDRRGVTCQRMSITKGKLTRLNALNKMNTNFRLGGFKYEENPLKLGDLKGNEFIITLRDVKLESDSNDSVEDIIRDSFESLKTKGFINYFGMQRFGSFSISSHELGKCVLKEDWKSLCDLLLSEQEICHPKTVEARKIWKETRDPKQALETLPKYFIAEYNILKTLTFEKQDETTKEFDKNSYYKAIMSVPKNLRMMYSHAYQSYIWNLVVNKRIELYGLELQEGDLVLNDTSKEIINDDSDFEEDIANDEEIKVKELTKEDIESGKYTIFDVVLPSAGFRVKYPSNPKLRHIYVDVMSKDDLDPFKMTRKNKTFALTGTYRKIVTKPENLRYEIVKYSDEEDGNKPIVRTDLELLEHKKETGETLDRIIKDDDGNKVAVILTMQLGISSYATMCLREFMKIDTSRYSQSHS
ncbi:unnamed protein product [Candida verbasci]|uniref:TRUD domain-containing protein n=1 Tax=Candida verbasci TaxID=1227364 RepID=A0A9W4TX97_9ASCO|nr:unnamed protein product [Candida verbasci]